MKTRLAGPTFQRGDSRRAAQLTKELGIDDASAFANFYRRYEGPFGSSNTGFELLDLFAGTPNIGTATRDCRDELGLPEKFLVIADLLGGGVLIYDVESEAVDNVDLDGGERELIEGNLQPAWQSFAAFLEEYFGYPEQG